MAFFSGLLLLSVFCLLFFSIVQGGHRVNITLIDGAVERGAVCLDGSPPGYYLDPGCGTGANNWVILLEGGGWCPTKLRCRDRVKQDLGSTLLRKNTTFAGILDNNATFNPDYFNWNRVEVAYCDGASFLGDVEEVDPLYYRGSRVYDAVMDDLLARGLFYADNVVLTGISAGITMPKWLICMLFLREYQPGLLCPSG